MPASRQSHFAESACFRLQQIYNWSVGRAQASASGLDNIQPTLKVVIGDGVFVADTQGTFNM